VLIRIGLSRNRLRVVGLRCLVRVIRLESSRLVRVARHWSKRRGVCSGFCYLLKIVFIGFGLLVQVRLVVDAATVFAAVRGWFVVGLSDCGRGTGGTLLYFGSTRGSHGSCADGGCGDGDGRRFGNGLLSGQQFSEWRFSVFFRHVFRGRLHSDGVVVVIRVFDTAVSTTEKIARATAPQQVVLQFTVGRVTPL